MIDYFEDEIREWHWYLDPKNRAAALQIVSDFNKKPASFYDSYIWTLDKDLYHDPDDRPDVEALQRNVKAQRKPASSISMSTRRRIPISASSKTRRNA